MRQAFVFLVLAIACNICNAQPEIQVPDLYRKSQKLEQEVRDLKGKLEQTEFKMQKLSAKLDNLIDDLNYQKTKKTSSSNAHNTPGAKPEHVQLKENSANDTNISVSSPDLQRSIGLIQKGNLDQGINGLFSYVKRVPTANLSEPHYWIGVGLFKKGAFEKSGFYLAKSYKEQSSAEYAPDALLKLAMSLKQLGNTQRACGILSILTRDHSNMPDEVAQNAKLEAESMGCS